MKGWWLSAAFVLGGAIASVGGCGGSDSGSDFVDPDGGVAGTAGAAGMAGAAGAAGVSGAGGAGGAAGAGGSAGVGGAAGAGGSAPVCANDAQCQALWASDGCKTNVHCETASATCTFSPLDNDHDGNSPSICGGGDCNDADPNIHPGLSEACDGKDNDCNGQVDDGATCAGLEICQSGACTCPTANACGQDCVDKSTDPKHCGACGNACASGATCQSGTCVCNANATVCSGACVDTKTDPKNCGGCSQACPTGYSCVSGQCTCTGISCGGVCIDKNTDPNNCGGCGVSCGAQKSCQSGQCVCSGGTTSCNGTCTDTKTDPANCGSCAHSCGGGGCVNGQCTACVSGGMLLVFDSSGSMGTYLGATTTRLAAEASAVNAFVQDPASNGLTVALIHHPIEINNIESCTAGDYAKPAVAAGLLPGLSGAIGSSLAAHSPAYGSSPTSAALDGAIQYAKGWQQANPGRKMPVVLLVDSPSGTACTTGAAAIASIASAGANGSPKVLTYVVSIGNDPGTATDATTIANAGGTTPYNTGDNGENAIRGALSAIRATVLCP